MDEVIDASTYEYERTVMVEVTGRDDADEITVFSYEFDVDPDDERRLRPRESIEHPHEPIVRETLTEAGYELSHG